MYYLSENVMVIKQLDSLPKKAQKSVIFQPPFKFRTTAICWLLISTFEDLIMRFLFEPSFLRRPFSVLF